MSFRECLLSIGYPQELAVSIAQKAVELCGAEVLSRDDEPGASYFIDRLSMLKKCLVMGMSPEIEQQNFIGNEFDFLSSNCWDLGFFKTLCLAASALTPKTKQIAIVATVRNEGPFILEWIAHHQAVGVEDFFIYTNDNTDGSLEMLRALATAGVLFLIESEVAAGANPQVKAYEHSLMFNEKARQFDWLMFLDADELFLPFSGSEFFIGDLLHELKDLEPKPASVSFNWMWMGSGGNVRRQVGKRLAETFEIGGLMSSFVKSLVDPSMVVSMRGVHKPVLSPGSFGVDSALKNIDMNGHGSEFNFVGGEIRHYWNKSFEEFLVKQNRGADRAIWERNTELFFDWDITQVNGTMRPFPDKVSCRTEERLLRLRSIPGITTLEARISEAYTALAISACPSGDVDKYYRFSRSRSAISGLLKSAPVSVVDTTSASHLLQDVQKIVDSFEPLKPLDSNSGRQA